MNKSITDVKAREVLDSRGNPTIEVEVFTETSHGRFIVPSGASTGAFEAVELRDKTARYNGKGVLTAVSNVHNKIRPKIIGYDVTDQSGLDNLMIELDGTENKANFGANAILGISIAALKAAAQLEGKWAYEYIGSGSQLPLPMLNVINGGKHAGGELAIQEFMLMPLGFDHYKEALRASVEVYHALKKHLKNKYGGAAINIGDEGGFAPPIDSTKDALRALQEAIANAGYSIEDQFHVGIDAAASEFFHDGIYHCDGNKFTPDELVNYYFEITDEFPFLLSLEDPFDENDYESFGKLVSKYGKSKSIVGDDLTVTNVKRINTAIEKNSMNYLLLKINQIGTFTEAKEASDLTKSQGWGVQISHRSGETEDAFIADLAVGLNAERIKTGAPARSDRVAKYNQLLRIEERLGSKATFYNKKF